MPYTVGNPFNPKETVLEFTVRRILQTQEFIMSDNPMYFVQGDLLFMKAFDEPPSREPHRRDPYAAKSPDKLMAGTGGMMIEEPENGFFILARGEKTGHAHRIAADVAEVRRTNQGPRDSETNDLVLGLWEEAVVVHDEHPPLKLEPGTYIVRQQREFNPYREIEERDQERTISRARFD
jgi:hypothetical protein